MLNEYVSQVRAFSRFYTVFMGILNKSFLKSKYSLPETRVLHAVYTKAGITPSEIILQLHIDKSYLSRMIIRLEKEKLITKEKSKDDARSLNLFITALGKEVFEQLTETSNKEVGSILEKLSEEKRKELVDSMASIEQILSDV